MVNAALKNLSEEEGGEKRRGREKEEREERRGREKEERRGEKERGVRTGGEQERRKEEVVESLVKKKKDFKLNSQPALGVEGSQTGVEENCCQETL